MRNIKQLLLIALTVGVFFSCKKDDEVVNRPDLVIPENYDGAAFETNAASELNLRAQLIAISNEAKKGRVNGVTITYDALTGLLNAGTPSLKASGTTYFMTKLDGANGWLAEMAKASGGTYTPGAPTGEGGTFNAYLFDENGLEIEQVMEKGMFGAVQYKRAVELLNGSIDATTADKVLALFGANPTFPNSNNAAKAEKPDVQLAAYVARRTDINDANGLYFNIKNALIKLQAAGKAGADYAKEQQEAASVIKLNWEKGNAATIANYLHSSFGTLSGTSPTDAQIAGAIHSLAECVGFIQGYKTIADKKITDAQIDQILALLNAPANGTPEVYKFATERETQVSKLSDILTLIKSIYGFTDTEIESFKNNWVSLQGR